MRLSVSILSAALLATSAGMAIAAGRDQLAGSATEVQATTMTDVQVRQKLEAEGYTDVRIGERDKGDIEVTAAKEGKTEKLAVNPQSGQVTPNTKSDDDDDWSRSRSRLNARTGEDARKNKELEPLP